MVLHILLLGKGLKVMASKYSDQEKIICNQKYNSHQYDFEFEGAKYKKLRITTIIENVIYEYWTSTQTWKNASESKQSSFNPNGWRFPKYFKAIGKVIIDVVEKTFTKFTEEKQYLLPAKLEDISLVNFWGRFDQEYFDMIKNEFTEALTLKEIKAVYRKYAKRLHPDTSRASNDTFEILKGLYEVNRKMRIVLVDNCREAGIDMEY